MGYLEIRNLCFSYPEATNNTLRDINLVVEKGEVVLLLGESGSGKSTLLKCVSGAVPDFYGGTISGCILYKDKIMGEICHQDRSSLVTMVFQDPERQLLMDKVHREVAFGLENTAANETGIKRRVMEALQFSGLSEIAEREISTLSGGQKQRVALAAATAYIPEILLLDEPTSQLDPSAADEVLDLVEKINSELGTAVIISEQRVSRWIRVADRIVVLRNGEIIFNGKKEDFYSSKDENVCEFHPSYLKLAREIGVSKFPENRREVRRALDNIILSDTPAHKSQEGLELISVKGLKVDYKGKDALKGIDLSISKGDFTCVMGPNGAGKTTFLRSLMGLVNYSGKIKLQGKEVRSMKLYELARIAGYVSQDPNDYISKDSVYDELKFTLDNHGIRDYHRIDQTLSRLGILELGERNPRDLSGGERQRVAIASVMVVNPEILFLDEPTRGLDTKIKNELGAFLSELNREGTTIIMVTHDTEFAGNFCSKFVLLFNGELASYGDRDEVLSDGIYYTTEINRLVRHKNKYIFTLKEAIEAIGRSI